MEKAEEKLWGIYNTFDTPEAIQTWDEIDVWKKINNLGGALFWSRHDEGKVWASKISQKDLIDAQYNLEFLVYSTKRFGVEFSKEPSATEHVERSESYDAWFSFWQNHFESMPQKEFIQFVDDKCSGKDITKYMPTSSWNASLQQTIKKLTR